MICAARLTSPTTRGALADSIDVLVRLARFGPFFPSVRRHREVLLAERRTLAQITRHLRAPAPVSPEGAARLADFLWSRSSPLFNDVAASVIQATIARSAETLAAATPQR